MNNQIIIITCFFLAGFIIGQAIEEIKCKETYNCNNNDQCNDVVDNYWKLNDVFGKCILTNVQLAKEHHELIGVCKNGTSDGKTILYE